MSVLEYGPLGRILGVRRPRTWHIWTLSKVDRYIIPYLSSDENWLATFFGLTGMSVPDIDQALKDMRPILYGELPCTRDFFLSINIWTDLNIAYWFKLMDLIDFEAIEGMVRALFNSRWTLGGYTETMDYIQRSLSHSLVTGLPAEIDIGEAVKEKLLLHFENNYTWARVCVKGLIEAPTPFVIIDAFENVKRALEYGYPVDQMSKQMVHDAVQGDIDSLDYTRQVVGARGIKGFIFHKLEDIEKAVLERVDEL